MKDTTTVSYTHLMCIRDRVQYGIYNRDLMPYKSDDFNQLIFVMGGTAEYCSCLLYTSYNFQQDAEKKTDL